MVLRGRPTLLGVPRLDSFALMELSFPPMKIRKHEFSLRQLEVFARVVSEGSYSKAAQSMDLSQPTVSEHMASLEQTLGARLVDRVGGALELTTAGRLFHGYTKRILALVRETFQAMNELKGVVRGELIVAGSTIPGVYILPPLIMQFTAAHPDVRVGLKVGDSRFVVERILDGHAEVGMIGKDLDDPRVWCKEFADDELVVAVGAKHPWAKRREVSVEELADQPFVVRERGSATRETYEKVLENHGLKGEKSLRVVCEMGSTEAVKEAVRVGIGVSILSHRALAAEEKAGQLHTLRLKGVKLQRKLYLVRHATRTQSPIAKAFLAFLDGHRGGKT